MRIENHVFANHAVDYVFGCNFSEAVRSYVAGAHCLVTDEHVFEAHKSALAAFDCIVLPPGEQTKSQATIDNIVRHLLERNADKDITIIGVGGGVVTDIAGYAASIYKRGVKLLLAPTSLLAMTDASIGGKNGVNVGEYKNMVGTNYQPSAILFDYHFLSTLPDVEWASGFAEIIKHACIKDASMFLELEKHTTDFYKQDSRALAALIENNVAIKNGVVKSDEFETGERKLLNFGHTIGHAIENIYRLPHGHAVSLGIVAACKVSEEMNNFYSTERSRVVQILERYNLPVRAALDKDGLWQNILKDKKTTGDAIHYILLNKIGEGVVSKMPLVQLKDLIERLL